MSSNLKHSLRDWVGELASLEQLSDEEDKIAGYIKNNPSLYSINDIPRITREEKELLSNFDGELLYKLMSKIAMKKLRDFNISFMVKLLIKNHANFYNFEDLIMAGYIGLDKAARTYNPKLGKFKSYAYWQIALNVSKEVVFHDCVFHIPFDKASYLKKIKKELSKDNAIKGTHRSLEDAIMDCENWEYEIRFGLISSQRITWIDSFDGSIYGIAKDTRIKDRLLKDFSFVDEISQQELREYIKSLLKVLDERERKVIMLRYGISYNKEEESKPRSLTEVGKLMNLSRERIRQIEMKALAKIKSYLSVKRHVERELYGK